jgi:hypothetical protein
MGRGKSGRASYGAATGNRLRDGVQVDLGFQLLHECSMDHNVGADGTGSIEELL